MSEALKGELLAMADDYARVTGERFEHFYCPVLFRDEELELCVGHVVGQAFAGAARAWTVQRKDVDNFYGSLFESDFELLQERLRLSPATILSDSKLSRAVDVKFLLDGKEVQHYPLRGTVPSEFTPVTVHNKDQVAPVVLKMTREELIASAERRWEFEYRKDVRLPALVSVLKAAHLTLFDLLGYAYVFTAGGHFLGHDILGRFFLENREKPKREALVAAEMFFREFQNMMRPVTGWKELDGFQGGVVDQSFVACEASSGGLWALIVFVNTGQSIYAVIVPGEARHVSVFLDFLANGTETINGRLCRFDGEQWAVTTPIKLQWPKTGIFLP